MEKRKKYNYKKIALFVFSAAVVLFVVIKLLAGGISLIAGHKIVKAEANVKSETTSDFDYEYYEDGVAYANSQGIKLYDFQGNYKKDIIFNAYNPYIDAEENFIAICDMKTDKLSVIHKDRILAKINLKQPVTFAKVNKNGYIAAATTEKGYKSAVYVYDKNGKEKYMWHSDFGYVVDCLVTEDNKKLVVLSIVNEKNKVNSAVTWFKIGDESSYGQVILPDCFAYELVYRNNKAYVISSEGIYSTNSKKVLYSTNFNGRELLSVDVDSKGDFITAEKISNTKSCIVKYNKKMKEKYLRELDFEVNEIKCNGKRVAVAGNNNLAILNSFGRIYATGTTIGDVNNILLSDNGKHVISFSQDKIDVYNVKLGKEKK